MQDTLLQLAVLANRIVEAIKRLPGFERVPEAWRSWVLLVISWVVGVALVALLAPDANVLAGSGLHPIVGLIVTGIAVAAGSNAIAWFLGVGAAVRQNVSARAQRQVLTVYAPPPAPVISSNVSTPAA